MNIHILSNHSPRWELYHRLQRVKGWMNMTLPLTLLPVGLKSMFANGTAPLVMMGGRFNINGSLWITFRTVSTSLQRRRLISRRTFMRISTAADGCRRRASEVDLHRLTRLSDSCRQAVDLLKGCLYRTMSCTDKLKKRF